MKRIRLQKDAAGNEWLETELRGKELLTNALLNKGTAFSLEERAKLGIEGKLPPLVETIEAQAKRAYSQYEHYQNSLQKHIYLNNLHDKNETLFYKLVSENLAEMIPIMYTPIVGTAVQQFSHEFRQPRGLYITPNNIDQIDQLFANRTHPDARLLVITDGKGVLGLGDQGVGAMEIPIAKLMVYSLLGGINPADTLPIMLDVGTDNEALLNDPFYLGLRQPRLQGDAFYEFVDQFVQAIRRNFADPFLHWEDLGRDDARYILDKYKDTDCSFNDDIQGTGAVALAAVTAASRALKQPLAEHRIVIYGAGTAGVGIADQICQALVAQGLSLEDARKRFWLLDKPGLLFTDTSEMVDFQRPYARATSELADFNYHDGKIDLLSVVQAIKPTVLLGCSARHGAFDEQVVQTMASNVARPIICPLSNPNNLAEAYPADILRWSDGKALVATGSPFAPVTVNGTQRKIAQCNNALIFPGVGLAVLAAKAQRFTEEMLLAGIASVADRAPVLTDLDKAILPDFTEADQFATDIALSIIRKGIEQGVINSEHSPEAMLEQYFWRPNYRDIRAI